jgi:hypothetical protein
MGSHGATKPTEIKKLNSVKFPFKNIYGNDKSIFHYKII